MRLASLNGRLTTFVGNEVVDVETAGAGRFGSDPQLVYERRPARRPTGRSSSSS